MWRGSFLLLSLYLQDVDDECEDVADEEDEDDDHEHGGEADLALLQTRQLGALRVGAADLRDDTGNGSFF